MKIQEMHELFRVLAQRMGLQNVRGIISEEIDVLLNNAINAFIKTTLLSNATVVLENNVLKHNTPIGYINALRTLYCSESFNDIDYSKVMYYVSFSCEYRNKVFKARLVEADKVDEMNSDFCSRASLEYPIVTLYNDKTKGFILSVYPENTLYKDVIIRYIKYPNIVKYDENTEENCVHCDLPDYTHNNIVELAATQYFQSLNLTTQNNNK